MLRSLFSGISGLRAHQTMLDVTGNNIANVNTTGFKSSQTQFQDTLSQVLSNAAAPAGERGGTNPAQVGLGVRVAGITTNFSQGAAQLTNRSTDMMISGDGFFVVQKGTEQLYTRAGAFNFDAQGNLVTPDGAFVQGWAADATGAIDVNAPLSQVRLPGGSIMGPRATTTANFAGNLPSDAAVGTVLTRQIDVYDAGGNGRTITTTFTYGGGGAWTADLSDPVSGTTATANLTFTAAGAPTAAFSTTLNGVTYDLGNVTGYAGQTTIASGGQDGNAAGALESFTLGPDGTLTGSFTNGLKQPLARIALSTFANPAGLEKAGNSTYRVTANSGDAMVGEAGAGGRGELAAGVLEMSNVDLSSEFTALIIAQRGFQANSRIITTSDQVLEELVNLKR